MTTSLDASGSEPGSADIVPGAGDEGSDAIAVDVLAGLETDSLKYAETNGIKSMSDALTKSRELEKLVGNSVRLPGADASDDDHKSFLDKTLKPYVPESVDGYEFAMPEDMPEGMAYDSEFVGSFKEGMLERGMPPQFADQVHDWFVSDVLIPQFTESVEATQAEADASNELLVKEWGEKDSPEFKAGLEHVMRAVNEFGGDEYKEALLEAGVIDDDNNILNAALLLPLAKISQKFMSEDSLESGDLVTENPFADETRNWTKMNDLVQAALSGKQDPKSVKALIQQAGKEPAKYGLS